MKKKRVGNNKTTRNGSWKLKTQRLKIPHGTPPPKTEKPNPESGELKMVLFPRRVRTKQEKKAAC